MAEQGVHSGLSAREFTRWRNAIFTIFALSGLLLSTWASRLPVVRGDLGLSHDPATIGLMLFGLSGGAIIGLSCAAQVLERFGPRLGMLGSLGTASCGIALAGVGSSVFHSAVVVAVGLIILGFGNGMVDVIMNVEGTAVERARGKTLLPLMHASFSLGTVLGAIVATALTALHVDVIWHFGAIAIITAACATVAVRYVPEAIPDSAPVAPRKPRVSFRQRLRETLAVWSDWRLVAIGVVMLGMSFGEGSANDWISLAVVDGHNQANATGAAIFGVFVAAETLGRILGGPIVDRIGRVWAIRITAGLGTIGLVLFINAGALWVVILATICWGIGISLGFPLGMSSAAEGSDQPARRVAAVASIGYFAFLVGPPLIGYLGQEFGLLNALYLIAALLAGSFFTARALRPATVTLPTNAP